MVCFTQFTVTMFHAAYMFDYFIRDHIVKQIRHLHLYDSDSECAFCALNFVPYVPRLPHPSPGPGRWEHEWVWTCKHELKPIGRSWYWCQLLLHLALISWVSCVRQDLHHRAERTHLDQGAWELKEDPRYGRMFAEQAAVPLWIRWACR